jgi:hypothetical protein
MDEEKAAISAENEKLREKLHSRRSEDTIFLSSKQEEEYKKEIERFREENYKLEGTVDDLKFKQQVLIL